MTVLQDMCPVFIQLVTEELVYHREATKYFAF